MAADGEANVYVEMQKDYIGLGIGAPDPSKAPYGENCVCGMGLGTSQGWRARREARRGGLLSKLCHPSYQALGEPEKNSIGRDPPGAVGK